MASGFGSGLASVQSDPVVGRCLVAATEISQGAVVLNEKPLGERVLGHGKYLGIIFVKLGLSSKKA